ncbi:MAG: InlB B-repeat-containing protein, partial [Candidatus Nanopelagicales bacterium]
GANAGKYLIGGYFTDTGTVRVARLNADGTRDTSFTPVSLNDPAYSVTEVTVGANAGKYLIGGQFTDTGTVRVARLNTDGTQDTTFTPLTLSNGSVWSVAEVTVAPNAGKYLIGGSFTNAGGDAATDYVARLLAQLPTHTVTFAANGGSGSMSPQSANVPTPLDANTFTRAGFSFTGWNTAANGSGTAYADGASFAFTADQTLYAQWSALPTHTVTFAANGGSGSMSPQSANVPTPLDANTFTRAGFSFTGWNTAANGSGTAYANGASFPFSASDKLYAQWKSTSVPRVAQTPRHKCVTPGSKATSIPRRGSKRLMKPGCVTNAGKTVGVKVRANARTRGDWAYYRLYCKVGAHKAWAVKQNASGVYCKKGALRIRTYGYKLRLQITWSAPANARYTAYKRIKNYRT